MSGMAWLGGFGSGSLMRCRPSRGDWPGLRSPDVSPGLRMGFCDGSLTWLVAGGLGPSLLGFWKAAWGPSHDSSPLPLCEDPREGQTAPVVSSVGLSRKPRHHLIFWSYRLVTVERVRISWEGDARKQEEGGPPQRLPVTTPKRFFPLGVFCVLFNFVAAIVFFSHVDYF